MYQTQGKKQPAIRDVVKKFLMMISLQTYQYTTQSAKVIDQSAFGDDTGK